MSTTSQSAGGQRRWSLSKSGAKSVLRYQPPESEAGITFDIDRQQLGELQKMARKQDTAGIRDLLLTEELRAKVLKDPSISALISANTWRWALPLFGGEPPHEQSGRKRRLPR